MTTSSLGQSWVGSGGQTIESLPPPQSRVRWASRFFEWKWRWGSGPSRQGPIPARLGESHRLKVVRGRRFLCDKRGSSPIATRNKREPLSRFFPPNSACAWRNRTPPYSQGAGLRTALQRRRQEIDQESASPSRQLIRRLPPIPVGLQASSICPWEYRFGRLLSARRGHWECALVNGPVLH